MRNRKSILTAVTAMILFFAFGFGSSAQESDGGSFADMPDNWSTEALQNAVNNGLLQGADGMIRPDDKLTRSQMAALIVRAFGAVDQGDLGGFTDVGKSKWYYEELSKAYRMGIINGYGDRLNPDSYITRQEACAILARAFKLEPDESADKTFSDIATVADWAKGYVFAAVNSGYLQGYNGMLDPEGCITRAQFAQILDNCIAQYISAPGEYTAVSEGSVMINTPGVMLKDLTVSGDLVIGDGVGDGDVTLDHVTVTGRLVARGGGVNTVKIVGNSDVKEIVVARVRGEIRVFIDGALVDTIKADSGDDIIIEGNAGSLLILGDGIDVTVKNAEIDFINVEGSGARISLGENTSVGTLNINSADTHVTALAGSSVKEVAANGAGTVIEGSGKVDSVHANANNVTVNTAGTTVTAKQGTSGVVAGTVTVKAGESVTTGSASNKGSSGSTDSTDLSGSVTAPAITGISGGDSVTGAVPMWTDASGTTSSAELNGAAYIRGTPVLAPGAYSLTVTAVNSSGKTASATVSFTIVEPDGTAAKPYPIPAADDLNAIRGSDPNHADWDLSDSYIQITDIDLSAYSAGSGWDPLGDGSGPFTGSYNGNGYAIKNLSIHRPGESRVGLFGYAEGASIEKVTLNNAGVAGGFYAGGIAGRADSGTTISACSVSGDIKATYSEAGGIAGEFNDSAISDCYAAGNVSAGWWGYAGGLVGYNDGGTIEYSYAACNVSGSRDAGGLVGYNNGTVAGSNYVLGGSVICSDGGYAFWEETSFGRIAGENDASCAGTSVSDLKFYANPIDGTALDFSGTAGVNGASATGTISYTGWDFTATWKTGGDGKPVFLWQTAYDAPRVPFIQGVGNNAAYYTVTPVWTTEAGVTYAATVSKGGISTDFTSGSTVDTAGTYLLTVTGTKTSNGLRSTASMEFTIDRTVPSAPTITGVTDGGTYNATLPDPSYNSAYTCAEELSEDGGTTFVPYDADLFEEVGSTNYVYKVTTKALTYPEAGAEASFTVNGAGTETKPFVIYDADDLQAADDGFEYDWGYKEINGGSDQAPLYYVLQNNISLGSIANWQPLGGSFAFYGVFNGGGHTISNLTIDSPDGYKGLFSQNKGEISNLYLIGADVSGNFIIGGLVGQNGGLVSGCKVGGTVSGEDYIGGLVGINYDGSILGCSSSADVTASGNQGGGSLVGQNNGLIQNCSASGSVTGDKNLGGLVGSTGASSVITKSFATGAVTSTSSADLTNAKCIGGLVGTNYGSVTLSYATGVVFEDVDSDSLSGAGGLVGNNASGATISDSYASGDVTGKQWVGGVSGINGGTISKCYAIGDLTGASPGGVAGNNYGSITASFGKADAATMSQADYEAAEWDFDDVWTFDDGSGYPTLR